MLTTIKAVARMTRESRYSLIVIDESGIVHNVIAENLDIRDVIILEKEHAAQPEGKDLATICNVNGSRYWSYNDPEGPFTGWQRVPC